MSPPSQEDSYTWEAPNNLIHFNNFNIFCLCAFVCMWCDFIHLCAESLCYRNSPEEEMKIKSEHVNEKIPTMNGVFFK